MAQKHASPTKEQVRVLEKNGLDRLHWVVVREFGHSMIVRHRETGEFRTIDK